mmetsp:Transcript_35651/g.81317  ORF Transcript_35651/g.81317 Transcript_35651/m.81317 type:complete len:204 (+) Transcript_35651:671-1282(+)
MPTLLPGVIVIALPARVPVGVTSFRVTSTPLPSRSCICARVIDPANPAVCVVVITVDCAALVENEDVKYDAMNGLPEIWMLLSVVLMVTAVVDELATVKVAMYSPHFAPPFTSRTRTEVAGWFPAVTANANVPLVITLPCPSRAKMLKVVARSNKPAERPAPTAVHWYGSTEDGVTVTAKTLPLMCDEPIMTDRVQAPAAVTV